MAHLIAFFSRKDENYVNGMIKDLEIGNTEIAAGMIQKLIGGDLFKIEQVHEYSKNYNDCIHEAMNDQKENARPELKHYLDNIDEYDTIYLGYPNYWGTMPMAVFTFLEKYDFTGKTIRPFCTHEGSGMGRSIKDIKTICPDAEVEKELAIYGGSVVNSEKEIKKWLK
ncbi:MAG: flavodoxin [Clostridium sp.]